MSTPVKNVSVEDVKAMLAAAGKEEGSSHTYLDVRTPEEFASSCVPHSINIPYMLKGPDGMMPSENFLESVKEKFPDKETSLLVGCRSGTRSTKAVIELMKEGYTHAVNVDGGLLAWQGKGFELSGAD